MTMLINTDPLGQPQTLSSGGVLAFGEQGPGDPDNDHDGQLIERGNVRVADTLDDLRKLAADLEIPNRTKLSRDDLAAAIAAAQRAKTVEAPETTAEAAADAAGIPPAPTNPDAQ